MAAESVKRLLTEPQTSASSSERWDSLGATPGVPRPTIIARAGCSPRLRPRCCWSACGAILAWVIAGIVVIIPVPVATAEPPARCTPVRRRHGQVSAHFAIRRQRGLEIGFGFFLVCAGGHDRADRVLRCHPYRGVLLPSLYTQTTQRINRDRPW